MVGMIELGVGIVRNDEGEDELERGMRRIEAVI
jgi:hypothetical protein